MQTYTFSSNIMDAFLADQKDTHYIVTEGASISVSFDTAFNAGTGAANRDITVDGTIYSENGTALAVGMASGKGGGLLEVGATAKISGFTDGIDVLADHETVRNAGWLHSNGNSGLECDGAHTRVENTGTIDSTNRGIDASGNHSKVFNSGTIDGDMVGISVFGNDVRIVNSSSILSDLNGVVMSEPGGVVSNTGTISGGSNGVAVDSYNDPASSQRISNFGTISGNEHSILGEGGIERVRNAGSLIGDVSLAGGDDVYDGRGGTVSGTVRGGRGDDTYIVDSSATNLSETSDGGIDSVRSSTSFLLSAFIENLTLTGKAVANAFGNDATNILRGNAAANVMKGEDGADQLSGGAGNDVLLGGLKSDVFIMKTGSDHDTVGDMTVSGKFHDVIDLSRVDGFENFADVQSHLDQSGTNAILDLGHGDELILVNIDKGDLGAMDFHF